MGQIISANEHPAAAQVVKFGVAAGLAILTYRIMTTDWTAPHPGSPRSPLSGGHESFISAESADANELEGEIEKTAEFIESLKRLMADEVHGEKRKRQLEESLSRAESSFNNLFELKTKLGQHGTNRVMLDTQVTSEIAKSSAMRDIEERLLWTEFGRTASVQSFYSALGGDSSPVKRQRTLTS